MKFEFIAEHQAMYPVTRLCRALDVSSSGFYAWRRRGPSRRAQEDCELQRRIKTIHQASRVNYGSPKLHVRLQQEGIRCSRKRVIRLMRQANIFAKRRRCYKRTTRRNPAHPVAPNRLQQCFEATCPNQIWLADITYIPTGEGWLYLATVMDLYSRRIVGWAMESHMKETLVHKALGMALSDRAVKPGQLIHHSDRGSQYTSANYQALLGRHKIVASMSSVGNCYDNAPMESFFSLLKTELVHHDRYPTRQAARSSIFDYIEVFYNRERIHSAIDYLSPLAYEQRWQQRVSVHESQPVDWMQELQGLERSDSDGLRLA
jgi:putative transposase